MASIIKLIVLMCLWNKGEYLHLTFEIGMVVLQDITKSEKVLSINVKSGEVLKGGTYLYPGCVLLSYL